MVWPAWFEGDEDTSIGGVHACTLCQDIRTQYPTYDDPNTGSHLVVLWRIPDVIRTVDGVEFQQGLPDMDN